MDAIVIAAARIHLFTLQLRLDLAAIDPRTADPDAIGYALRANAIARVVVDITEAWSAGKLRDSTAAALLASVLPS